MTALQLHQQLTEISKNHPTWLVMVGKQCLIMILAFAVLSLIHALSIQLSARVLEKWKNYLPIYQSLQEMDSLYCKCTNCTRQMYRVDQFLYSSTNWFCSNGKAIPKPAYSDYGRMTPVSRWNFQMRNQALDQFLLVSKQRQSEKPCLWDYYALSLLLVPHTLTLFIDFWWTFPFFLLAF